MLGTVFMVTLPELLRGYVNLQQIMFGAILFATMAFLPGGLIELGRRLRKLLCAAGRAAAAASARRNSSEPADMTRIRLRRAAEPRASAACRPSRT